MDKELTIKKQYQINKEDKLHIASLTTSKNIIINTNQIELMDSFSYDIVITQQSNQIYAYNYNSQHHYVFIMPSNFYELSLNFQILIIDVLLLCSQSITIPIDWQYEDSLILFLKRLNIEAMSKKGNNINKIYLEGHCQVSYIDFIAFQHTTFENSEILNIKIENAQAYCINLFKKILKKIDQQDHEEIQQIYQRQVKSLKKNFKLLSCRSRLKFFEENGDITEQVLEKNINKMIYDRQITTIGDEQCNELLKQNLKEIAESILQDYEIKQAKKTKIQNYNQIFKQIIFKYRKQGFEMEDNKYMFAFEAIMENLQNKFSQERSFYENLIDEKQLQNKQLKLKIKPLQLSKNIIEKVDLLVINEENQSTYASQKIKSKPKPIIKPLGQSNKCKQNSPSKNTPKNKTMNSTNKLKKVKSRDEKFFKKKI